MEHARPIFLRFWPLSKRITRSRAEVDRNARNARVVHGWKWSRGMERNGYSTVERFYRSGRGIYSRDGCSNPPTAGFVGTVDKSVHPREKVNGWCLHRGMRGTISIHPYREITSTSSFPQIFSEYRAEE